MLLQEADVFTMMDQIHSTVDKHGNCFQCLTTVNSAVRNIHGSTSRSTPTHFLLGLYLGEKLLNRQACSSSVLLNCQIVFQAAVPINALLALSESPTAFRPQSHWLTLSSTRCCRHQALPRSGQGPVAPASQGDGTAGCLGRTREKTPSTGLLEVPKMHSGLRFKDEAGSVLTGKTCSP